MSANDSVFLLIFLSGLLGGIGHCSGMCGPLVAAYSLNLRKWPGAGIMSHAAMPHVLYNAGRLTTYSLIGGVMGLTGSFSGVVSAIGKFQNITMAAIGIVMILTGAAHLGLSVIKRKQYREICGIAKWLTDRISGLITFISETHTPGSFYAIGMTTGFIPCGLLYTAYIAAAGAGASAGTRVGGFISGMFMMLLFGLGTIPALFLIGRIAAFKADWLHTRFFLLSALFMIAIGTILIYRSFNY